MFFFKETLANGQPKSCEPFLGVSREVEDKFINAFNYLFSLLYTTPEYNLADDDIFAKWNFETVISPHETIEQHISLFGFNGVNSIDVSLGGLNEKLILDSGASDVCVSSTVEQELINQGIISESNYISPALYQIADGSITYAKRFIIPYIKVGDFQVNAIVCSVNPSTSVMLLGKSFLDKFKSWSVDNEKQVLTLIK